MPGVTTSDLLACFDLETTPGLDPVWSRLLVVSVKPLHGEMVTRAAITAASDDRGLVKWAVEELSKYSILVAHNGIWFDRKFLNGRALASGLPILDPKTKFIDPYQLARRHLNMSRNSLDSLAEHLHLGEQKLHLSPEIWVRAALDHDREALDTLVERCESDVRVLEELMLRMLPFTNIINSFGSA